MRVGIIGHTGRGTLRPLSRHGVCRGGRRRDCGAGRSRRGGTSGRCRQDWSTQGIRRLRGDVRRGEARILRWWRRGRSAITWCWCSIAWSAGAHVYLEKPVAASVAEVDQMIAARDKTGVTVVVAHPWRGHPPIQRVAIPEIKAGKIGQPRLCRIYGMGGAHGGDQLFLDLYPHFFDFLWQAFGEPLWCPCASDARWTERDAGGSTGRR